MNQDKKEEPILLLSSHLKALDVATRITIKLQISGLIFQLSMSPEAMPQNT